MAMTVDSSAQEIDFTFSPSETYEGTAIAEMYTEHYVYVFPNSADTVDITWRVIENSCPEGWDFQMCDWQHCYDGFPNTAEMDPVLPGGSGYLKLLVNPFNIGGSGMVHFWVYPTGAIETREDVYFYFNATTSVVDFVLTKETLTVDQSGLRILNSAHGLYRIFDLHGREVLSFSANSEQHAEDLSSISSGVYILVSPSQNRFTFLKP
jgi:hypothetical protein